ncbi:MAG: Stk1 family PASTA domain-containing Ser/Thr kinase [Phoenicibacter congonensis]|uniref:non-specific serine/threonine protein kinase n=1 Tax=Phoenicibacter congonensis TaxID=1944646 RepID=A0AA43RHI6_9ACTN|nr:Stk1 family PASTA domain-containing Ser/Thr kinase [Phoenicibacter congonensis]
MTATSMTGKVLNKRYEIGECIGVGGMAEVYSAQDNVLGRIVAVKVMLPQYAAEEDFARRFRQEAAAAANLQSPYIVNVYDWGHDAGTYFIVMEYVRGSDLKSAIKQRGAINQRKVAEIGSQVCQALTVAHSQDIIHRDIKPQNIMIQPDGNVKVMDFGIARSKNSLSEKTGNVLGTAHYISPEQAQGKDLTAATDIYSLGVCLYEAATGKLPFDAPDAMSVAMMQVQDQPMNPRDINPEIDPALESIILKAMSKNPSGRYATAHDMKIALNDYLAGRMNPSFTQARTSVISPIGAAAGVAGAAGAAGLAAAAKGDRTEVMPTVNSAGTKTNAAAAKNYTNGSSNKQGMSGKMKAAIGVGVAAALIVVGLIVWAVMNSGTETAEVPDVTGKTTAEAVKAIEAAGFTVGSQDSAYDTSIEAGKVSSQSPKGGEKAAKGSKINIVVSQGTEEVTVPDLSGKTLSEAQKALANAGFALGSTSEDYSDSVDSGKVMSQDPAANKSAKKGSTVNIVISKGSDKITVPDLSGKTEQEATAAAKNAGLSVSFQYAYSDSVSEGLAMKQSESAGSKVSKGTEIVVTISEGKKPAEKVTVPSGLVGSSWETVSSQLKNLGLNPSKQTDSSSSGTSGTVTKLSPGEGSSVEVGDTVTVYVAP